MRWVLSLQPSYFVDFLLNFQTFEIIELWFVTLKGAVDIVFTTSRIGLFGSRVSLENDHSPAFVSSCQEVSVLVEFDTRYDVGFCNIVVEGSFNL